MSSFTLALAQMAHPADGNVISAAELWARETTASGAQLLVFPECFMTPFEKTPEDFAASAQPLDGPFAKAMQGIAKAANLWIVFTLNEANPDGGRPFNTAVVVDSQGILQGSYRKTHLYIAHGLDESQKMTAGQKFLQPIETPFCTLGLGICYDLRFPELTRAAALEGADVVVFPSAWVDGPNKIEHWHTLLAARAIENQIFVAGCCRPDANCIGHSQVVDPLGLVVASAAENQQLLLADIDLDQVRSARYAMPCMEHRQPSLYRRLTETQ